MLSDLVDTLADSLSQLIDAVGLPGIFVMALMENMFPPTPSEYIYPLVGKSAADGVISLGWSIVMALAGSLLGSLVFYAVGYVLGPERVREGVIRYGTLHVANRQLTIIHVAAYDRAVRWFERRGGLAIVIGRNLPFVHSAVSIPAGVVRMPLLKFVFFTTVGVSLWIVPLILFGYWLGSNWEQVLEWLDVYAALWYGVIALAVVWWLARRWWLRRSEAVREFDEGGEAP